LRFDPRGEPVLLKFDREKGCYYRWLAPTVIDNSIVDQLADENFFGKELR
jgi:hypothetical protein